MGVARFNVKNIEKQIRAVQFLFRVFQLSNYWKTDWTPLMKTASPEIRDLAIKAYESGISRQQIADIVGYHLNSVSRWIHEFKQENRLQARPRGHRISMFSEAERCELTKLINERSDITLEEIRAHFVKPCSLNAIHKLLKSFGFIFKKNSEGKRIRAK